MADNVISLRAEIDSSQLEILNKRLDETASAEDKVAAAAKRMSSAVSTDNIRNLGAAVSSAGAYFRNLASDMEKVARQDKMMGTVMNDTTKSIKNQVDATKDKKTATDNLINSLIGATATENKFSKAVEEAGKALDSQAISQKEYESLLDKIDKHEMSHLKNEMESLYDPTFRQKQALKSLNEDLATHKKLLDGGAISQQTYAQRTSRINKEIDNLDKQLRKGGGKPATLTGMRDFQDIIDGLSRGDIMQAVRNVMALQTTTAGFGGTLRAFIGAIGPVNIGIAAVAISTALLVAKLESLDRATNKIQAGFAFTGSALKMSDTQIQSYIQTMSNMVHTTKDEAVQALNVLGRSLIRSPELFKIAASAADGLGAAIGGTTVDAMKRFAEAQKDPLAAAKKLFEETEKMTSAEVDNIKALVQEGKSAEATAIIFGKLNSLSKEGADKATELQKAIKGLSNAWDNLLTSMSKSGVISTILDQLTKALQLLEKNPALFAFIVGGATAAGGYVGGVKGAVVGAAVGLTAAGAVQKDMDKSQKQSLASMKLMLKEYENGTVEGESRLKIIGRSRTEEINRLREAIAKMEVQISGPVAPLFKPQLAQASGAAIENKTLTKDEQEKVIGLRDQSSWQEKINALNRENILIQKGINERVIDENAGKELIRQNNEQIRQTDFDRLNFSKRTLPQIVDLEVQRLKLSQYISQADEQQLKFKRGIINLTPKENAELVAQLKINEASERQRKILEDNVSTNVQILQMKRGLTAAEQYDYEVRMKLHANEDQELVKNHQKRLHEIDEEQIAQIKFASAREVALYSGQLKVPQIVGAATRDDTRGALAGEIEGEKYLLQVRKDINASREEGNTKKLESLKISEDEEKINAKIANYADVVAEGYKNINYELERNASNQNRVLEAAKGSWEVERHMHNVIEAENEARAAGLPIIKEQIEAQATFKDAVSDSQRTFSAGWNSAFNDYVRDAQNAAQHAQDIFGKVTSGMEDLVIKFAKTGKFEFKEFASSVVEEMLRIQTRWLATKLLESIGFGKEGAGTGALGKIFELFGQKKTEKPEVKLTGEEKVIKMFDTPTSKLTEAGNKLIEAAGYLGRGTGSGATPKIGAQGYELPGGMKESEPVYGSDIENTGSQGYQLPGGNIGNEPVYGSDIGGDTDPRLEIEMATNEKILDERSKTNEKMLGIQETGNQMMLSSMLGLGGAIAGALATNTDQMTSKQKAAFYVQKAISLAEVIVNTSVAYTKALASSPSPILGIPMATIIAGLGAAQAAVIVGTMIAAKDGAVFNQGGLVPFANGGIINQPTPFRTATGQPGIMGEAGAEGILPLTRIGGKLGVHAQMGQQSSPNVNVPVKVINIVDPQMALAAMSSKEGEKVIINAIEHNPNVIRKYSGR